MLESQQSKHEALAQTLRDQVEQKLHLLEFNLNHMRELVNDHANPQRLAELISPQLDNSAQVLAQIKADLFAVEDDLVRPIPEAHNLLVHLSGREQEVLQLIADGKSTTEIAELLYISTSTIYTHRQHIMEKLDIDNASDLVKFALHHQLNRNFYDGES